MKKFEYMVLDQNDLYEYTQRTGEGLQSFLNGWGYIGYELVAIDYASFIFKKELDEIQ